MEHALRTLATPISIPVLFIGPRSLQPVALAKVLQIKPPFQIYGYNCQGTSSWNHATLDKVPYYNKEDRKGHKIHFISEGIVSETQILLMQTKKCAVR
jgi:hypothetical protein